VPNAAAVLAGPHGLESAAAGEARARLKGQALSVAELAGVSCAAWRQQVGVLRASLGSELRDRTSNLPDGVMQMTRPRERQKKVGGNSGTTVSESKMRSQQAMGSAIGKWKDRDETRRLADAAIDKLLAAGAPIPRDVMVLSAKGWPVKLNRLYAIQSDLTRMVKSLSRGAIRHAAEMNRKGDRTSRGRLDSEAARAASAPATTHAPELRKRTKADR
jgi:hypothetical protein